MPGSGNFIDETRAPWVTGIYSSVAEVTRTSATSDCSLLIVRFICVFDRHIDSCLKHLIDKLPEGLRD